jgi:hypothetical protein
MFTNLQWILLASIFIPALTLLGLMWILRRIRSLKQERSPVSDKLLRPPGESLRREIERLDDQVNDILVATLFGPAVLVAFLMASNNGLSSVGSLGLAIIILLAAALFALLVRRLVFLVNRKRNFRLRFAGERAVAEELNQLMLNGYHIFHDVPMDPYGNIDHVIIGPSGIYAIETKTRRKRNTAKDNTNYKIVFDGKTLRFPSSTDSCPLEQARQQADRLRADLSKAVGESVKVGAIVTFPGWWITRQGKSEIMVLNPKEIRAAVLKNSSSTVPKQLIERIVYQLDRKCRDVEF